MTDDERSFWSYHLYDSSRACTDSVVEICLYSKELFEKLLRLSFSEDGLLAHRASRVVSFCMEKNFAELGEFSNSIIDIMPELKNESILFNFLRIYNYAPLPSDEIYLMKLYDFSLLALSRETKRNAVIIYAIENLTRITQIRPEYCEEVFQAVKPFAGHKSPSIFSRARRALDRLAR